MTKTCRQGLEGQSVNIANKFASVVAVALLGDEPVKQVVEPSVSFDSLADREVSVDEKTVESDGIRYMADAPLSFSFRDIGDNEFALPGQELAKELQDWNGQLYEVIWTPANANDYGTGDQRKALALALQARKVWPEMLAMFEPGTLLYNAPKANDETMTVAEDGYKNTRARLYERSGFGKLQLADAGDDPELAGEPFQLAMVQSDGSLRPVKTVREEGMVGSSIRYAEKR